MVWLEGRGILHDILIPAYVMFAIAIPFYLVFGRDKRRWWALIPAGIMTAIGISFLAVGKALQFIGLVVLIILGIWLLSKPLFRKKPGSAMIAPGFLYCLISPLE